MDHLEIFNLQMRVVILLLLISTCYGLWFIGREQSIGVKGKLVCNGMPAEGVKVKLREKEIFLDRELDQGETDAHGEFKLWGSAREISKIDPQLNIYHKCNYRGPCYKKLSVGIPSKYIVKGNKVDLDKYYDIGTLELSMKTKGQTIDCINYLPPIHG
ncbi:Transthyretin-like family protein [Ancylostoma caninum]|uniref:Transthyretin-like family protein n=1 Tax=Ancylostoma caninum TaxID=29170 RepID=A0A368FV94_ANCCA|nr:Transthyretin-like family protein [Ancylostoma caninum]